MPMPSPATPALLATVSPTVAADHAVVRVAGEIDADSVAPLHEALDVCIRAGVRTLLVDAQGVTFCDTTAVNVLLTAARQAAATGATLTVGRPSPEMARLLDLTATAAYLLPAPDPPPTVPGHVSDVPAGCTP
ncbi:STAS domain-containing protein [Streptomyces sp. CB03911]|uniref:STAS domain-containing protein n=1 Tax=Streptomyces sp. CB03911 TaxID=1804758 RepID=UPI0009A0C6F8|nr:STAS domain-containing protein [Streptomyces sp. CB03911]